MVQHFTRGDVKMGEGKKPNKFTYVMVIRSQRADFRPVSVMKPY